MIIAVLSDIHGNDIALGRVLDECRRLGVERLFVLGDLVGYYCRPDSVLKMLTEWPSDVIAGNHEAMLMAAAGNEVLADQIRKRYGSGIDVALRSLSQDELSWLASLPARRSIELDGLKIELCHGSPWDRDFYVYPDAPQEVIDRCFIEGAHFVFMGHTHRPFIRERAGTLIANVGSVGQARDQGMVASWGILDTSRRTFGLRRTVYDPSLLEDEARHLDPFCPYLHEILRRNC